RNRSMVFSTATALLGRPESKPPARRAGRLTPGQRFRGRPFPMYRLRKVAGRQAPSRAFSAGSQVWGERREEIDRTARPPPRKGGPGLSLRSVRPARRGPSGSFGLETGARSSGDGRVWSLPVQARPHPATTLSVGDGCSGQRAVKRRGPNVAALMGEAELRSSSPTGATGQRRGAA